MNENARVPMWKKLAYGCGAGGGNVMSTLLATFLTGYYTGTAGIAMAAVGTMFLICRLLDGVTDFAMGGIVDKTNTKLGKARPWLIIAAPLMCIGVILILNVPQGWDAAAKLVYAYLTYIFLNCIVYTIFGIAHAALLARMTRDFKDRNTTATVSSIVNSLAGLVAGVAITNLYLNVGWAWTGVILGVVAGVLILIPGLVCEETVGMDVNEGKPRDAVPMKEQLPAVLKNKYFWLALLLGTLVLLVNGNAIGAQFYYCDEVLHDPEALSPLMVAGMAPGIVAMLFMPYFSNKFSKRAFMAVGALLMVLGFSLAGLANTNMALLIIGVAIRSIGITPMFAGLYAFVADAADYGEWKFGIRSEGLMAASQSIGSKIGIGFGSAVSAWIIAAAGYIEHTPDQIVEQPASVAAAVRFDYGWMGAILSVVLLIFVLLMDVEKYLPEIRASLGEKKPPMEI